MMSTETALNSNNCIQCPVCSAKHLPLSRQLQNGGYATKCQSCGHIFKFRTEGQLNSNITLTVNKKSYRVLNDDYFVSTSLNTFLRNEGISRGTKFMCREGGCGCCLVLAQVYNPITQAVQHIPLNSCMVLLYTCNGWTITTVEGVGSKKDGLSPVQEQIVKYGATQCGMCTPGMVMNMHGVLSINPTPTAQEIEDAFDGNICRCTGYRSILDAMKSFATGDDAVLEKCKNLDIEDVHETLCKKTGQSCTGMCSSDQTAPLQLMLRATRWFKPISLHDLYGLLAEFKDLPVRLIYGNTATGVYYDMNAGNYPVLIDIHAVPELSTYKVDSSLVFGSNLTLTALIDLFELVTTQPGLAYLTDLVTHLKRTANFPIRNAGTWAGNLMMKHKHTDFISDIFVMLETVAGVLRIGPNPASFTLTQFLALDMKARCIEAITLPLLTDDYFVRTFKIMPRAENAHAYVNAGFRMRLDVSNNYLIKEYPSIVYGGINNTFIHATKTETYLNGNALGDPNVLKGALAVLNEEIVPDDVVLQASEAYRKSLALSLFYKYVLSVCPKSVSARYVSGGDNLLRPVSSGQQTYETKPQEWPLTEPISKLEAAVQTTGEAEYIMDIREQHGELFAAFVVTSEANATIDKVDPSPALAMPGVLKFISFLDIPKEGVNNFYPSPYNKEEVFCSGQVEYAGQAVGLIIAENSVLATMAAMMVIVTYTNIKPPILTIPDAIAKKSFFPKPTDDIIVGNAEQAITNSPVQIGGTISMGGQYHFYMETQICICSPTEDGLHLVTSTQWIAMCQQAVAQVIGIANSSVSIDVRRLGGAYGGKITRNMQVASACAVAANVMNRPVRLHMDVHANMQMIGSRIPYQADYKVGVSDDGLLNGILYTHYADVGVSVNDNCSSMVQTFADNAYHCENWHVIAAAVKTNKPANTACRSPGSVPAIFIMETIMEHIAKTLNKDPTEIKQLNLYQKGQVTPLGIPLKYCNISELVSSLLTSAQVTMRKQQITQFNQANRWKKKGLSIVPIKFGAGWMSGNYNVMISVYEIDGTVSVCHAGIEMGQGINTKVAQVCAYELGIPMNLIRIKPSNTLTGANSSTSGGSITSELNCQAAIQCCKMLIAQMAPVKTKMMQPTWLELVQKCFQEGVDLCARYWNFPQTEYAFQYQTYGVTCAEVELDVLTGENQITRVDILYDCGESMNPNLDIGQTEGAFIMGLGNWLTEKLIFDPASGRNLTNNTWEYKPPSSKDIPIDFRITFLKDAPNPLGVLSSKIVAEPPQTMSCSALFALKHAIESARAEIGEDIYFTLDGPATVDVLQTNCLVNSSQFVFGPTTTVQS